MEERLAQWEAAARAAGARGDGVRAAGADLLVRWGEPHRAYHDLRHLDEVLDRVDLLAAEARDVTAVRLAAWFHDAVYDVRASDSEERSAALAEEVLARLGVEGREVGRLVRITAAHAPRPGDADGAVLSDADLGVLASPAERYAEYAADVRREYAHVPDAAFAAARAAVLGRLVAGPRLFRTPAAAAWEEQARSNVAAELERLSAPGGAAPRPAAG